MDYEGTDAFATSVDWARCFSQSILDFGQGPLEEVSCCDAFFGSNDGAWSLNGSEEGINGKALAGRFWSVEY